MQVKSMRGRVVNMSHLLAKNQTKAAIGNASLNARGDKINAQGEIIKSRDDIFAEYNTASPRAVKQIAVNDLAGQMMTPTEAVKQFTQPAPVEPAATAEAALSGKRHRALRDD